MKLMGFYVCEGDIVSPTVFRKIALEKVSSMKLGKVKEPSFRDRHDIIEFELPKLEVDEVLKNSLQNQ